MSVSFVSSPGQGAQLGGGDQKNASDPRATHSKVRANRDDAIVPIKAGQEAAPGGDGPVAGAHQRRGTKDRAAAQRDNGPQSEREGVARTVLGHDGGERVDAEVGQRVADSPRRK